MASVTELLGRLDRRAIYLAVAAALVVPLWFKWRLPPAEMQAVCSEIRQLEARRQEWEEQKAKLREMQARHAGRGLLNRLLDERAKERARG